MVELKASVKLRPFVPLSSSADPDTVTTLKVLSVTTTKGVSVKTTVVVCAPESVVCAKAAGANISPPPSAIDTANAGKEMPDDSAPICGDMLAARPFHLVIRPPRKITAEKLQIGLADSVKVFFFIAAPKKVKNL